eukprot:jgi/Bigna1/134650/aug1.26_g9358
MAAKGGDALPDLQKTLARLDRAHKKIESLLNEAKEKDAEILEMEKMMAKLTKQVTVAERKYEGAQRKINLLEKERKIFLEVDAINGQILKQQQQMHSNPGSKERNKEVEKKLKNKLRKSLVEAKEKDIRILELEQELDQLKKSSPLHRFGAEVLKSIVGAEDDNSDPERANPEEEEI